MADRKISQGMPLAGLAPSHRLPLAAPGDPTPRAVAFEGLCRSLPQASEDASGACALATQSQVRLLPGAPLAGSTCYRRLATPVSLKHAIGPQHLLAALWIGTATLPLSVTDVCNAFRAAFGRTWAQGDACLLTDSLGHLHLLAWHAALSRWEGANLSRSVFETVG